MNIIKKNKWIFIIGIILGFILYWYPFWQVWILIAVTIEVFYFIEKRFKQIETTIETHINIPEIDDPKPISYQVDISIEPEWIKIIRWCFPKLKTDDETAEFMASLWKDPKLEINRETSLLCERCFGFVEFYDGVSGLNPIWSTYYKGFIKNLEVRGDVLDEGPGGIELRERFPDNFIGNGMVISPSVLGFLDNIVPGFEVEDRNKISQFPYESVINFFVDVQKNIGRDLMVKKFPEKLQQTFDEYQIKYDPWDIEDWGVGVKPDKNLEKSKWLEEKGIELYRQQMRGHSFKTPYFTIYITLKFFRPGER
jgi:hypothetical protein